MAAPTWYDVLGVDRDATTDEVRVAWRAATDRVEPGTGQFRSYNEAAETLLDPQRRASYDASLAPVEPPATAAPAGPADPTESTDTGSTDGPATKPRDTSQADRRPGRLVGVLGGVPLWVPALLLVLVLALAGLGTYLALGLQAEARTAQAREQAPIAAEQAAEAMLSYDYRQLPEDKARAEGYLTGDFKAEFVENAELLETQRDGSPGPAVQTKAVVTAQAAGSGVVDVSDDGRRARVLVFVNQTSEKEGQDPQIFQNRVAMSMVERDGRWLVSGLNSY